MIVFDIYLRQGQDNHVQVQWAEDGVVQDLSAWEARFQVRETAAAPTALLTRTSAAGTIHLDDTYNVLIDIPAAESSAWAVSAVRPTKSADGTVWVDFGIYDLEVVAPDGTVIRLVQGKVWLSPEVTR